MAFNSDNRAVETNKSKILILEDDESVGLALKEALSRQGYTVFLASRPDDAMAVISGHAIQILFCDCLLPQMTGLDFIERARQVYPKARFKVVLMSGIYTDKQFIQESVERTKALAFFKKPFDLAEVIKLVKREDAPKRDDNSGRKMLYQMFANSNVTNRQKRKVIESIEEVSGFDLPFLYSLLVETRSSGFLNIYNADGSVSGISFSDGCIVAVDVDDKNTFIGEMLIQSGFVLPEHVQIALRDKSNRKIGSFLIQKNQLSPHAFDLILMEQMNVRLVRTIVDQKIKINFSVAEVEKLTPSIDADALLVFLHDWIASKITVSWLKPLYMMWTGNVIVKSPGFREDHPALQMSLIKALDGFSDRLQGAVTLNQLLDVPGYSELAVYKAIHFLLTKGLVVFSEKAAFASPTEQNRALKKIWAELEGKNSFQIIEYLDKSGLAGITVEAIKEEFMPLIGAEPADRKSESYALWINIKTVVEEALVLSQDAGKVDRFRQEVQRSEVEAKLKATLMMEEVKKSLQLSQFAGALKTLAEVEKLCPQIQYFHIYSSWAKLGAAIDPTKKAHLLKEIELEILQIAADERYDALFPFVVGLFNKQKGDLVGARKSFEKSIALDSSFIPARRELSLLSAQSKKQDVFNMDLKDMVSGFFKKK